MSVMATAAKIVYPHIVKEPGYCGGKAAIDSTRVRVNNVAWLAKRGLTPQEMLEQYPDLTLAQVYAALRQQGRDRGRAGRRRAGRRRL